MADTYIPKYGSYKYKTDSDSSTKKTTSTKKTALYVPSYGDYEKNEGGKDIKSEKQKNLDTKIAEIDAKVEQSKKDVFDPGKILQDNLNAAGNLGKTLFVDPAVSLYKQTETAIKGGQTSFDKGAGLANEELVKNQEDYIKSEADKGTISKERADEEIKKLRTNSDKSKEKLQKAEQETGVKYNPGEGAFAALDTIGMVTGLGEIGLVIFKKAAQRQAEKLGRDLTEDEVQNLAEKTKSAIPEQTTAEKVVTNTDAPVVTQTAPALENIPTPAPAPTPAPVLRTPIKSQISKEVSQLPRVNPEIKVVNSNELSVGSDALGEIDSKQVDKYIDDIQSGKTIEPIIVQNRDGTLFVEDGKHRLEAAKELGIQNVPIIERSAKDTVSDGVPTIQSVQTKNIESTPKPKAQEIGDTTSGNAARIEAKAIEKKLTDTFGDLPQYKSINMKEQADEAVKLISNDRKLAEDIIDGKTNPPGNLKSQSVHQALEEVAIKDGDVDLLQKLAKSPINKELSESAQNLRIAAERDPYSAVENIRQVQDARAKISEKRSKTTVKKEASNIKKKVDAATPKQSKESWSSFAESLVC